MNTELERWLKGVTEERRVKARARSDMRTTFAEDIRTRITRLEAERVKTIARPEFLELRRDERAHRIEGLRDALHMIVGVRE